jgi:serine protease Do
MVVGGSGVIISPDGYVVTNHHVAEKAIEIRCVLHDNSMLDADLIGTDPDTDLALLKLKSPDPETIFPYAELADARRVEEGQFVMALGAPWGLKRSISLGVVASAQRFLDGASEYSLWIQSDASLNPGNSGGPLVNTEGRVVGINTMGSMWGGDLGFSVPADTVAYVVEQIKAHGSVKRSWTGLRLQPLRDFERDSFFEGEHGVLVASVDPGSPAEKVGFGPGDLILSVGGVATDGLYNEDLPAIRDLLGRLPIDQPVAIEVRRDGKPLNLEMTVRDKGSVEGEDLDLKRWNMTVKAVNEHYNPGLFYYAKEGVYVQAVRYNGNADDAGLGEGSVILEVDGQPIKTLEEMKAVYDKIIADETRQKRVLLKVMDYGIASLLVLDYARDYDKEQ